MHSARPNTQLEQRHRRIALLALGALVVLSISPVLGHHVVRAVDWLPASLEHLGPLCMVALHHLLAPVHEGFHYVLAAGLVYAIGDRMRAAWQWRGHLQALDVESAVTYPTLVHATQRLEFPIQRIHVASGLPNSAFATGWITPRIYVAQSLMRVLSPEELEAVVAHEVAHVRRRDPLRFFLLRALACTLFWMPAFRRLVEDLSDEAEMAADDAVSSSHRLALASAMLRVAGANMDHNTAVPATAVRFFQPSMLERRVRRLAGETPEVVSHVSRRSITAAAAALMAVWASGVMVLHPLPADASAVYVDDHVSAHTTTPHCNHHHAWSWSHLFCRADTQLPNAPCPHEVSVVAVNALPRSR